MGLHVVAVRMSKVLLEWVDECVKTQAKKDGDITRNSWIHSTLKKIDEPKPESVENIRNIDESGKQLVGIKVDSETLEKLDAKTKDNKHLTRTRWIELCLLHELENC